jgi:two-component system OmpR family sensor kinase
MNSIRRRLLLWQISALIVISLLASLVTYLLAWNGFNRIRDYGLEQIAYSVVRHGLTSDDDTSQDAADEKDQGQFVSQIWNEHGELVYSSLDDGGPPPQKTGLHVLTWHGQEWHTYTVQDGGLTIQVGNPTAHRITVFRRIAPWMLTPMLVFVALLGGLIWAAVGRALAPLERVRREISERDALSLSSVDVRGLPEEVAPTVEALNELLTRLNTAMTAQRHFIADAAHELRTPLTAIKLQAQIAQRGATPQERQNALTELDAGVERAGHLIAQLLQMARLEPEGARAAATAVRLDDLAKKVVGEWSAQAEARDIDLGVTAALPLSVTGRADSLRVLLDNLVDNALRYIPAGGRVDLAVGREGEDGPVVLSVADNGPGIPAAERDRVFERFHRLAGSDIPGSGLGLAIVREIVAQHHGEVFLSETPGGGLTVRILFPNIPP